MTRVRGERARHFRALTVSIIAVASLTLSTVAGGAAFADDTVIVSDDTGTGTSDQAADGVAFPSPVIPLLPTIVVAGQPVTADAGTWPVGTTLSYLFTVDGIPAPEQDSPTFTFSAADVGRTVGVTVIARHADYDELAVPSETQPLIGTLVLNQAVSISGVVRVGTELAVVAPVTDPDATSAAYSWVVDGLVVGTGLTFTPRTADLGKKLSLAVTASRDGYISVESTTVETVVGSGAFSSAPTPAIVGTAKVGIALKASPGTWSPSAKFTYRWLRNGAAIRGATASTYKLVAADWKTRITLEVTAVSAGYTTTKAVSAPTAAVVKPFTKAPRPRVTGTVRVGATLTASLSAWSPKASFSYQWKRNGVAIPGATARTYRLTANDYYKSITVTVTGRATGYAATGSTSAATAKTAAPAPSITRAGTYRVGSGIAAGTYYASAQPGCYWERRSSAGSSFSGIIANDYRSTTGRVIVTISKTDRFFMTNAKCGRWTKLVGTMASTAGNGTYMVGMHLAPGVYLTTTAKSGCYWEIVSSFGGTFDEIIENDYVTAAGPQYVRIYPDDKGFTSSGCGVWKRVSD
ncbi:MAG: hypothetical protein P0Y60_00170 [Candidatus Microbacterium colombiense]|nr:MAG: hypothetical protein P0Y60_00170 [Microbacterium sp.]